MKPVALVTGGTRGIGRAIVEELASTHEVIGTYRSNRGGVAGVTMFECDLGDLASCAQLAAGVREKVAGMGLEGLDLLVNNAGMAPRERKDILEATPESFDEVVAADLRGPYFLTQSIARWMLERGSGRIVFIGSISSFTASTNRGEYCVAKAGLSMAVKLFAARLAPHGIPVFEIQPGVVRTDMIAAVAASYETRIAEGLVLQRRMGEPKDVAGVVRAIADGKLDYCTGQTIHADGGFHLRIL